MKFMSFGAVTNILTSSAYATTAVFWVLCPILIPVRLRSKVLSNGFKTKAKGSMLTEQPCLTERRIGKGPLI
jgi:hypothetical protein